MEMDYGNGHGNEPDNQYPEETGMNMDNGNGHGNEQKRNTQQNSEVQDTRSEQVRQLQCCGRVFTSIIELNNHQESYCQINRSQHSRGDPRQTNSGTSQTPESNHSGYASEAVETIEDKCDKINWPKANERKAYAEFEESVIVSMKNSPRECRTIDEELTQLSDAIYNTGESVFGKVAKGGGSKGGPSRANRKLQFLRREKRRLRKDWEKATSADKQDLRNQREEVMRKIRDEARRERK